MTRTTWWRRYRGWVALGVLLAIGATAYAVTHNAQPADAGPTYTTETSEMGTLSVTVAGTGNLAVRDTVSVNPATGGTVAAVKVSEGATVSAGDVLYVLDDDEVTKSQQTTLAAKRQASEAVQRAELSLVQAQNSLDQLESRASMPSSTASAGDIEAAQMQVDIAEDGVTSANASYSTAAEAYQDALDAEDDLTVTAPCDGRVLTVDVEVGDAVSTGSSASSASSAEGSTGTATGTSASSAPVTISRDGELALALSVNEVDVSALKVGQSAELAFDAVPDLTMTGKVYAIDDQGTVSQGVVTYTVYVSLDVGDPRLKVGMSSSATIVTQVARDVLLVPNAAVKSDDTNGDYVQVLDAGSAEPRTVYVTTGLVGSTQTQITEGLDEGVAVVTKTVTASDASDSSSGSSGNQGRDAGFMMQGGGVGGPPMGGQ